ncbi:hypothetical protein JCGZ_12501 [Jatropha curcas]|uniref:Uncharacterized protein n=1 Tax=Jatropha curcas TaxID=180498 RepID=A0A067KIE0_JATCU|nr:uncharacterized protein LOC105639810 [Jatropha curcas]KDP32040.1 hypothetical protein JCGZ_12501 [Jatropha curcas]
MARNEEGKWENSEEEEEVEALSLCDLPINLIKEENHQLRREETEANQEDFDFSQFGRSVSTKSEMCAADDIFFQGQILPFRLSISSESGTYKSSQDSLKNPIKCFSRSESLDHGFTSFSSRSSSSRSQFSSTSTTSSVKKSPRISISKQPRSIIQNQFHTHPSPKPQIRLSTKGNTGNNRNSRKSTVWDIFRLGVVRTPEIELQDLKVRASVSRNSSSNSSNSNSSIKISSKGNQEKMEKQKKRCKQRFLDKKSGLLSGCSCTVSAVKPVPLNVLNIKSGNNSTGSINDSKNEKSKERGSTKAEQKLQEMKIKKKKKKKKMTEKQQQQGKQVMSRHRTFEWIKELSHDSFLDHEEEKEGLDS